MIRIPVAEPSITNTEMSRVQSALLLGEISGIGKFVTRFEEQLMYRTGRNYCIATSSGTMALLVLMKALGIGPGDEVIVPNFTFVAPAACAKILGARVVLADIELENWTIDPKRLESLFTPKTKLVVAVEVFGHSSKWKELKDVCGKYNIPIIQDAAQAHGNFYEDDEPHIVPSGGMGIASIFSFFANKTITCGEGGCILTDDAALAEECRLLVNHGMIRGTYSHSRVGFNARLGNVQAAIGLAQMERWDELIISKKETKKIYEQELSGLPGLVPSYANLKHKDFYVPYLFCLFVDTRYSPISATSLHLMLKDHGIDTRLTWPPLSWAPQGQFYNEYNQDFTGSVCEHISSNTITLPTHQMMKKTTILTITDTIKDIFFNNKRGHLIYETKAI